MKKIVLYLILLFVGINFIACSSDNDDDFGHTAKYSFVGKTYIYQWTLQNTSADFQYVIRFLTDSTFTLTPIKVETGESLRDHPAEGYYEVGEDGTLFFSGVGSYLTKIRGQRITLYKGIFSEDYSKLEVYRYLQFNSGKGRTDWIDFFLQ